MRWRRECQRLNSSSTPCRNVSPGSQRPEPRKWFWPDLEASDAARAAPRHGLCTDRGITEIPPPRMRQPLGMRHRVRLPRRLGERFSVRSAEAAGIRPDRYSTRDLHRPFRGVRSVHEPKTFEDFVRCYFPRLKHGRRFGGLTAARAWGLPVPTRWCSNEPLEIIVPWSGAALKTAGVRGRRLREDRATTLIL